MLGCACLRLDSTAGHPTCLVFADKLVVGEVELADCAPLCAEEEYRGRRAQLEAMIDAAPAA